VSDQIQEKEKSLAELMVRILKEPLKPLGESVKGLEGDLTDIKAEIELVGVPLADCLAQSTLAAKRSKDAVELLGTLRDEQAAWSPQLQAQLAKHAQAGTHSLDASLRESLTALAQSEHRVLKALADVGEAQRSATDLIAALPMQLSESRTMLDNALVQWALGLNAINSTMASGLKAAVAEISQRLEHQHKATLAVHQVLFNSMKDASLQSQAQSDQKLQASKVLVDTLSDGQARIIGALNQHTGALTARLDQSQAKLRQLTITLAVFFGSMMAYVGYELLSRFS